MDAGRMSASWTGSSNLDRLLELGFDQASCEAALALSGDDMRAAAAMLVDGSVVVPDEEAEPPEREPAPEPEPDLEGDTAEGVPPGAQLIHTNTLPARSYSGEEITVMYHGTDSRAAQKIASSQKFLPSGTGLLGPGIYTTRTRQKAEGYRVHHPNANTVVHGSGTHNLPLPSGDPDPGCILRFKVQLGACLHCTRDCDARELETWHDTPVPEMTKTSSMKEAAIDVRTLSGSGSIRYLLKNGLPLKNDDFVLKNGHSFCNSR